MADNTEKLIFSPARVFISTTGAALPSESAIAALGIDGAAPTGFTDLGKTTEALTLTDSPKIVEATSNQDPRALDVAVSMIETTIESTWRSMSLTKLLTKLQAEKGQRPKFAALLVAPWGEDGEVFYFYAKRCAYEGDTELAFSGEDYIEVGFTIKVLSSLESGSDYTLDVIPAATPTP